MTSHPGAKPAADPAVGVLIDAASSRAMRAVDNLHKVMRKHCPGPHEFVQHRDMRPPWCRACLRTSDGRRVERD